MVVIVVGEIDRRRMGRGRTQTSPLDVIIASIVPTHTEHQRTALTSETLGVYLCR